MIKNLNYCIKFFIFVVMFVLIFLFFDYIRRQIITEEPFENEGSVSILNLVLYSENDVYDRMYRATREYYKKFTNVKKIGRAHV